MTSLRATASGAATASSGVAELPLYGEAAAIRALYQDGLMDPGPKPTPPPRRPQRGKFVRFFEAARQALRGPQLA